MPFPLSKDTSCPPMPPIRGACCLRNTPVPCLGRGGKPPRATPLQRRIRGQALFRPAGGRLLACRAAYVEQDARHRVQTIGLPTYGFAPILPHGIRRRRCLKALGTVRAARRSGLQPRKHFSYIQQAASTPQKGFNTINWLVGVDWYAPHEWTVMAQFSSESIFKSTKATSHSPAIIRSLRSACRRSYWTATYSFPTSPISTSTTKGIVSRFTADYANELPHPPLGRLRLVRRKRGYVRSV